MDRRSFIRTGVATAAGASVLATAGCSQIPIIGSGSSYTNWLHEPGEFGSTDHYSVTMTNLATVFNNEDAFDSDQVDSLEDAYDSQLGPTDVDTDETDEIINTNVSTVYTGGFTASDVTEELEDNDFDDEEELSGFTIYADQNETRAWAVGSNALIQTTAVQGDTATEVAEGVVEVQNGEADRYPDEVEAMGTLTSTLSNGFQVFAQTYEERDNDDPESGSFENSTGIGTSQSFNGDTVNVEYVIAYEDSDDVDEGDLEDFVDAQEDSTFDDVDDISYSSNGPAGVISGTIDTDDVSLG